MTRRTTLTAVLLSLCLVLTGYILGTMAIESFEVAMDNRTNAAIEMMGE